jgi:hypothetical protein
VNIRSIIDRAKAMAHQFVAQGHDTVRLPVMDYQDWLKVYQQSESGESLNEYRVQTKVHYYLIRYLADMGVEVTPVPVRAEAFAAWCLDTAHAPANPHETSHALGDYIHHPQTPTTQCRHQGWDIAPGSGDNPPLATLTIFGETSEQPEVMSVVLHRADGQVLTSLELLAAEHTPQEAWAKAEAFLDKYSPAKVFHDQTIRYPNYCGDCNALLVNVASEKDVEAASCEPRQP